MELLVDEKGYLLKPDFCSDSTIVLPHNTKIICGEAFSFFQTLKEVIIPEGVTTIGEDAFIQCVNLETISLPNSLTNIGSGAFLNCISLEEIKLPGNVDYIKEMTFLNCQNLKKVTLSPYTTSISDFAFKNCYKLRTINIPKTIKRIGFFAFSHCTNLEEISLSNNLKEISSYCFFGCSNLKAIKVPNKTNKICEGAFLDCSSLESISLSKSVETIDKMAFGECSNIEYISLFNYNNLAQPGLIDCLNNIKYAFINRETGELVLSKNKISDPSFSQLEYSHIQKALNCSKSEAIIISCLYDYNYLKAQKIQFTSPILAYILQKEDYKKILKDILSNNKEYNSLYKRLSIDNLLSNDKHEAYNLFKLAYNLGAFSNNYIERQKACEFISNLYEKEILSAYNLNDILDKMNLNGYKKEWSTFIMKDNNFISLLNTDFSKKHLLSRSYNEISNIKELCRSNKGSQRYLSLTLDACQTYFSEIKFEGETKETKDIASLLYKFTRLQKTFDDAKEIRKEYLKLRNQNKIQDHLLEEKLTDNIFSEIEDEKEEILSNTTTAINNLSNVINNKFTFEFLSKYDATNFVLGKYCSCCSHLEAVGFGVVKASILHPDCQNLVIRDKSGKIIAKSTLYINRKEGYGLFNTIEIDENITNKEKKYIYTKYIQAISLFTEKYNQKNPQNPLLQINVGTHANDLLNELEKYHKESETNLKGIDFSIYGKDGLYHEGDWKQGQLIVWKKK